MHGSQALVQQFFPSLKAQLPSNIGTGLCVPACYVDTCAKLAAEAPLKIGSQDISEHENGAYTGEISATMIADCGGSLAIVGHSERRQYHGETGAMVGRKARAARNGGLLPIICIGETLEQRRGGRAEAVVLKQLDDVLAEFSFVRSNEIMIAYEPVWAIGTGETATVAEAQAMHSAIRAHLKSELGEEAADVALLYGGSVKPDNAAALFAANDIDGALVGGASLKATDFLAICQAASEVVSAAS